VEKCRLCLNFIGGICCVHLLAGTSDSDDEFEVSAYDLYICVGDCVSFEPIESGPGGCTVTGLGTGAV